MTEEEKKNLNAARVRVSRTYATWPEFHHLYRLSSMALMTPEAIAEHALAKAKFEERKQREFQLALEAVKEAATHREMLSTVARDRIKTMWKRRFAADSKRYAAEYHKETQAAIDAMSDEEFLAYEQKRLENLAAELKRMSDDYAEYAKRDIARAAEDPASVVKRRGRKPMEAKQVANIDLSQYRRSGVTPENFRITLASSLYLLELVGDLQVLMQVSMQNLEVVTFRFSGDKEGEYSDLLIRSHWGLMLKACDACGVDNNKVLKLVRLTHKA